MGTPYHLQVVAYDKSANKGTSDDATFTTKFAAEAFKSLITLTDAAQFQDQFDLLIQSVLPSLFPPFVEKPQAVNITEDSVSVVWVTNIPAFAGVSYAPEDTYAPSAKNPYDHEVAKTDTKETNHDVALSDLHPNTLYHYQASSYRIPEAKGKSPDLTFITKAAKIKPRAADVALNAMTIVWSTEQPTTAVVTYQNITTGETNEKLNEERTRDHAIRLENLAFNTPYRITVKGYTEKNNVITGDPIEVRTRNDTMPPVIGSLRITSALVPGRSDQVQMVLVWDTDEPSTSVVFYEEGAKKSSGDLANKVQKENIPVTTHNAIIPALRPGTLYQIRIRSADVNGNATTTPSHTVITPTENKSIFDIIIKNFEDTFKFLRQ